jgi:hypothetical protein
MMGLSAHGEFWGRVVILAALGHYVLTPALAPSIWPSLLLLKCAFVWSLTARLLWNRLLIVEVLMLYWGAVLVANLTDALKRLTMTAP